MLRAARVPPRGAAASLLEVLLAAPRAEKRRGVAAATELRRAALSRSFCALRLSDATRKMMRPAFISPRERVD